MSRQETVADVTSELEVLHRVENKAVDRVRRWLRLSAGKSASNPGEARLSAVLSDPNGLRFTSTFVDRVIRTEDNLAAAQALAELRDIVPQSLPAADRAQVLAGARVAAAAKAASLTSKTQGIGRTIADTVIPIAKMRMRSMVGHMIIDARPGPFGKAVQRLTANGHRLNINLLGEAVLGEEEADRHLDATLRLLARDDVDYVSVKVSSVASRVNLWAYEETLEYVTNRLRPLYQSAVALAGSDEAAARGAKFVNLDMEEYEDLALTLDVFEHLMSEPEFLHLSAGIVIQAYLPDALGAVQRLSEFAAERKKRGGADLKIRLVKGANLAMETVHADIHEWPLTTMESKQATDANYKLVLHWALQTEHLEGLRIGVAGHNLFDIAFAFELAGQRGVRDRIEFEMLQGMATAQSAAISADVGSLLLYVPAVHPGEFDAAISYLVRRLEENTAAQNFMAGIFDIANGNATFKQEEERFRASVAELATYLTEHGYQTRTPHRQQNRLTEAAQREQRGATDFYSEADTDPALPGNQQWVRALIAEASQPGWLDNRPKPHAIENTVQVDAMVDRALKATENKEWRNLGAQQRAQILYRAAELFAKHRNEFLQTAAIEAGKLVSQTDPEVSEAIDFIRYYAAQAIELERIQAEEGVTFTPDKLVVITPPWNFPIAIPTGGTVAALAVGASVIHKPSAATPYCSALLCELLWEAGVPRDVLQLAPPVEGELGQHLVSHPDVDRVILTGASETAELFRSFRPGLQVNAETSGKNALIVTPAADRDLAIADLVYSAFGHAGQKCSAASLGIMVGSTYASDRYRKQLVDAVRSLVVDVPTNLFSDMGPLTEDPSDKLKRALTHLEEGEEWLVEPKPLDDTGRLWSPGVKVGVKPGSFFHLTECFGPVLGLMHAGDLHEAIELQNAVDFGLTAGIHSLDTTEVSQWLNRIDAGNVYVNRGITGAIVRRQPFGGWKKSSVGLGSKAGGPNYLMLFGTWTDADALDVAGEPIRDLDDLSADMRGWVARAQASDQRACAAEFGVARDVTGLSAEANIFRYLPRAVTVRLGADSVGSADPATYAEAVKACVHRIASAAGQVRAPLRWSIAPQIAAKVQATVESVANDLSALTNTTAELRVENAATFAARVVAGEYDDTVGTRIRTIGPVEAELLQAESQRGEVAVISDPVTASGRVEVRNYVHEQAISMTLHRFGNRDAAFHELRDELMH